MTSSFDLPPKWQFEAPDLDELMRLLQEMPPDPNVPLRPRPTTQVLLERKERIRRFWRPRNLRMREDEKIFKLLTPVEERVGAEELGASETLVLNDPYVLVEKLSNMIGAQEPVIVAKAKDPGMKEIAQRVQDLCYWWRDQADEHHRNNLNNYLTRDEIYWLALRGWLAGRLMLDPGDPDWPYRYDVIDPIHVYPQRGPKGLRWVFHIYKDAKINILNDLGWSQDLLDRIEGKLSALGDDALVELASFFDDVWHVLFLNDEEVWSAPHNYGFVPWIITISFGPPIRAVEPEFAVAREGASTSLYRSADAYAYDYTSWWGVSVFQGIKDVYQKLNKLASAIMTEAMKAPNPPVVVYTQKGTGEAEGKTIDTSIGATNYLQHDQEDFKLVQYGFQPKELQPLMQMLVDARNRGALPAVMYGEGANYLSGFAVSLLQAGSRDIVLPLIKSHEHYLQTLFRSVLRLTAEIYPFPLNMVETDPQTGAREQMTTISPDEIKLVGYNTVKVYYKNIFPQDKFTLAQIVSILLDRKAISLDTARGDEFLGLPNPTLENKKVLSDLAWLDPDVVKAAIPLSLLETDPMVYLVYMQAQVQKMQQEMQQIQLAMSGLPPSSKESSLVGGPRPGAPGSPPGSPPGGAGPSPGGPASLPPSGAPPRPARARQIGAPPF